MNCLLVLMISQKQLVWKIKTGIEWIYFSLRPQFGAVKESALLSASNKWMTGRRTLNRLIYLRWLESFLVSWEDDFIWRKVFDRDFLSDADQGEKQKTFLFLLLSAQEELVEHSYPLSLSLSLSLGVHILFSSCQTKNAFILENVPLKSFHRVMISWDPFNSAMDSRDMIFSIDNCTSASPSLSLSANTEERHTVDGVRWFSKVWYEHQSVHTGSSSLRGFPFLRSVLMGLLEWSILVSLLY